MRYAEYDHYTDDNGVLLNKLGAKTDQELEEKERRLVAMRMVELRLLPIQGQFDLAHLQHIHRHLFQDIYHWAGELRTIGIMKGKTMFAAPHRIVPEFQKLHQALIAERDEERICDRAYIARRLAFYLGEINILHPFREGNGRSQREYIVQFAYHLGYWLNFSQTSQQEMIEASEQSSRYADNRLFEKMIFERLDFIK